MVCGADVEERIKEAGEVAAEQEGGDAGLVGLESERDDVAHEPHVFANIFGEAVIGARHRERGTSLVARAVVGRVFHRPGALDPFLDLANAGEILVELPLIGAADLPVQFGGVFLHAVENAERALAPLVVEEAIEGQRGINLHRDRREGIVPRDMRAIRHREVRLVVARDRLFAAEDQARLRAFLAEPHREHLIHAHPPLEHGPFLKCCAFERMLPV